MKDPDGFVERSTAQPGAALIGRVRAYSGYREDTSCPMHRWEVPAGELNLIVSFGDGFRAQAIPVVGSPGGISPPGSHGVNVTVSRHTALVVTTCTCSGMVDDLGRPLTRRARACGSG